jgi:hypothetical protein
MDILAGPQSRLWQVSQLNMRMMFLATTLLQATYTNASKGRVGVGVA